MNILEILKVIIIGIVEGITEWLPISSTGHMILVDELIKLNASEEFKSMFMVVIQLGAILAVVVLYFRKLNPFSRSKSSKMRYLTIELWKKIIVACLPAAMLGVLIDDWLDAHLYNGFIVAMALIVYGVLFILKEGGQYYNGIFYRLSDGTLYRSVSGSCTYTRNFKIGSNYYRRNDFRCVKICGG